MRQVSHQNETNERNCIMNNEEKNTYVRQQITHTLIQLLEKKNVNDISIKELCDTAMIGRASFYRNYSSKENVIATYAHTLIHNWADTLEKDPEANILNFFEHLFEHFVENKTFYLSLHKQGLSSILLDTIKRKMELTESLPNEDAYGRAWLAYGVYGLIEEWISRGMIESPSEMNEIIIKSAKLDSI